MITSATDVLSEMHNLRTNPQRSPKERIINELRRRSAEVPTTPVDIITFTEAKWGSDEKPYPIQKFLLKLIYGLPLSTDPSDPKIDVWDRFREVKLAEFTEAEFLDYLYREERCNISPEVFQSRPGQKFNQVIMRCGRRAGKTAMSQWVANYEIYRLLRLYSPQDHYRLRKDQPLAITMVATSKDQAQDLLAPARSSILRSPLLRRYVRANSKARLRMTTQRNIEEGIGDESGISIVSAPCSAKSLRGPANILALLEEYAFFTNELTGSNRSDNEIFKAISPSTAEFTDPVTGHRDGMILIISTPQGKDSHMHHLEEMIWDGTTPNGLIIQLPTAWCNPNIAPEKYKADYNGSPDVFAQEYEAEYVEGITNPFSATLIALNTLPPNPTATTIQRDEITVMGVDLGLKNDPSSISIVAYSTTTGRRRLIHQQKIAYGIDTDLHAKDRQGGDLGYLDIKKIAEIIDQLWTYYGVQQGIADQWNSFGLQSHLTSDAFDRLRFVDFNQSNNDAVATYCLEQFQTANVELYEAPDAATTEGSLTHEFLRLKKFTASRGERKYIKICAPTVSGAHDDQYSSLSRALWAAKETQEATPIMTPQQAAAQRARTQAAKARAAYLRNFRGR